MMQRQHRLATQVGSGLVRALGLTVALGLALSLTLGGLGGCSSTAQKEKKDQASANSPADKILVKKSERKLYLLKDGQPIRSYRVSLGINPKGHKERQGDNRTPEGLYYIDGRNPGSRFHKALHVSYPSPKDREEAAKRGVAPGGQIMIHGHPDGGRFQNLREMLAGADWTAGCIAVTNPEIEEIWRLTSTGTPIEIIP
jgi:murein L,D-transpeptidase YafK